MSKDNINHPEHYTRGSIEVYDFIEAWNLDFTIGNVVKYVARAPYKGSFLDDLKKARWYLNKAIEKQEAFIASEVTNTLDKGYDISPTAVSNYMYGKTLG